jgi:hypothetical protein
LSSLQNSNPLLAILWAGFTCGTLDISAALAVYRYFGRPPMRLLQGIAAGSEVGDGFVVGWSVNRKLSRNGLLGNQSMMSSKPTSGPEQLPVSP